MKIGLVISLILTSIQFCNAQDKPETSTGSLKFYVDHAAFKGKQNSSTYEEFYFMLYADELKSISRDSLNYAEFGVDLSVSDNENKNVIQKSWTTEAKIDSAPTGMKAMVLYDKWGQEFKPGNYKISVKINDKNGKNSGDAEFNVNIPSIDSTNLTSSQIEFVSSIKDQNIISNPSRRYGILNPLMYVYYELYNISDTANGKIDVTYSVEDTLNNVVKTLPEISLEKNGHSMSLAHGINVAAVPTGVYSLVSKITEQPENKSITISRSFEIIQMDYMNKVPLLTAEQIKTAENYLKYIATPKEYETFTRLNIRGKSQFLMNFWNDHDPTPGTAKNEYLDQIQQRYKFANEKFGWGKTEGWNTDRGRILIKYGQPNEIERHYLEPETDSYEVWYYHQNRNYEFDFADIHDNGDFVLLNSNKEDEVHNDNWKELITKYQ